MFSFLYGWAARHAVCNTIPRRNRMNEFKKKSIDEDLGGQAQNLKGKVKEGAGKLLDDDDLVAEGQADQAAGKIREGIGKAGRKISDVAERAADKISGKD